MTIEEAKQIKLQDYLHSLGFSPVKQQGDNLWYKSPFRDESEASFKVNTKLNQWYDFGIGQGGNIIALASCLYSASGVSYLLHEYGNQAAVVTGTIGLLERKRHKYSAGEKRMR